MLLTSSTLATATRHCAGANNHPIRDRSHFEQGIASHAVIQAIGETTNKKDRELSESEMVRVADAVAKKLIGEGRKYYGKQEPPLNAERVFAGRDLAVEFLLREPLVPGGRYEVGLACDANWHPCAVDAPQAAWRGTLDQIRVYEEEDEEWARVVLEVHDYKSAWAGRYSAKAWAAPSLQGKLYGCLAMAHADEPPNLLRLVGWNLRTRRSYVTEYPLPACLPDIERWRSDLELLAEALGEGPYPYTLGAGCIGCPAVPECPAIAAQDTSKLHTPEGAAEAYIAAVALSKALKPRVEGHAGRDKITVPGGTVGYQRKEKRKVKPASLPELADEWAKGGGELRGFLALTGLGVWALDKLAKHYHPTDLDARAKWLAEHVEVYGVGEFGIEKEG